MFKNKMNGITLEKMRFDYLDTLNSDQVHAAKSYGPLRYKIPQTNEEFKQFHQYYLLLRWELDKMEDLLNEKRVEFENKCDHDWVQDCDNRDERSRWKCTKCTKFR
tara:strand:+ start:3341 stop:3658 length:318 start_codon:yes stop_codon:yes gene_type:complete